MADDRDRERTEQARRDLARLEREGESMLGSAMGKAAGETRSEADDGIERLGKRIGRTLAYLAIPVAIVLFGQSAGWW